MSELHTTTYGQHGTPIVFCHGLFGQGRNWTQIAKALADEHRVLLVDLPHHGRSPWQERFDYLDVADRIADHIVAELPGDGTPEPVTLVGHSMGAKAAMLVALRRRELVERLCVVDMSPVAYDTGSEFAGYISAMMALDLASLEQRADADEAMKAAVPNTTVRNFLLQNLRRDGDQWRWQVNLDVLGRDLDTISGWPEDALSDVSPYDGPVLWLNGETSGYVQDEHGGAMDRWFPRNRRVTVKGAGHWVHSERPEVFVEVLQRFVDR